MAHLDIVDIQEKLSNIQSQIDDLDSFIHDLDRGISYRFRELRNIMIWTFWAIVAGFIITWIIY